VTAPPAEGSQENTGGDQIQDQGLHLGIVEHHAVRHVSEQRVPPITVGVRDRLRRDVRKLGIRDPSGRSKRPEDLVPRKRLIRGDVERVTERTRIAEQPQESQCEISAIRQRPKRCSVTMDECRQSAPHPIDLCPTTQDRGRALVVRVRRTHDRDGIVFLAVGRDEHILGSNLVL